MKLSRKITKEIAKSFIITLLLCLFVLIPLQKKKAQVVNHKIIALMQTFITKDIGPMANAIFEKRNRAINIRLADIIKIEGIKSAYVFDSNFKLLSKGESKFSSESLKSRFLLVKDEHFDSWTTKNSLWYLQAINAFEESIGFVLIEYSLADMRRTENLSVLLYTAIIFFLLFFLLLINNHLIKKISNFSISMGEELY